MKRSGVLLAMIVFVASSTAHAVDIASNQKGRLTSVGNGSTRIFHQYDVLGREVTTQYVQDGQSRVYSVVYGYPQNPAATAGLGLVVLDQTLPDGEHITFEYDQTARLVTMRSLLGPLSDDIVRDVRRNARGQMTRLELGNNVIRASAFDELGDLQLMRATAANPAGAIQDYEYAYDKNGNVTAITDRIRTDQSAVFEYDSLNQLMTFRNSTGGVIERYDYDAIGNLVQKGALTQSYNAEGRPHALASSAGNSYSYDPNGNVTAIGTGTAITWNAENMPTRVTAGSLITDKSFVNESLWKKVEQGLTTYYLPSLRVENKVFRKYYGGFAERLEVQGNRQLRFYHPDHLGSSAVMSDQNGTVIRRASYFPWGQDRGVDGTFTPKLQFNFKEKEASGFYDYGARLYNPVTGRWLSPDSSLSDGLNIYAYARNNPASHIDPTGHRSQDPKEDCGSPDSKCVIDVVKIESETAEEHDKRIAAERKAFVDSIRIDPFRRRENVAVFSRTFGDLKAGRADLYVIQFQTGAGARLPAPYRNTHWLIQNDQYLIGHTYYENDHVENAITVGDVVSARFTAKGIIQKGAMEFMEKQAMKQMEKGFEGLNPGDAYKRPSGLSDPGSMMDPMGYTVRRIDTVDPTFMDARHPPMPSGDTIAGSPYPVVETVNLAARGGLAIANPFLCWLSGCW